MILVAGATGTTGSAVVRELVARDAPVRALTRSEDRAAALREQGVDAAVGDAADPGSLIRALRRVERVYVALPAGPDLPVLEANLYAVAEQAGAYAVVKVGAAAEVSMRLGRIHDEAFSALAASSLRWTHLRPAPFMQNHLRARGTVLSARGDARTAYVDARDVAAVAARALTEDGHDGATYTLTGPEALTDAQVAATLGAELVALDDAAIAARRRAVMPEWNVEALAELDAFCRAGGAPVTPDVAALLGRPATPLAQLASAAAG